MQLNCCISRKSFTLLKFATEINFLLLNYKKLTGKNFGKQIICFLNYDNL